MSLSYYDPVSGRSRLKRRFAWGITGVLLGFLFGFVVAAVML